jgi:hypothetical protein
MSDPINADATSQQLGYGEAQNEESAAADYAPAVGEVVRLDDPDQDGEPRYALVVGEQLIAPLATVQQYELPLYRAG